MLKGCWGRSIGSYSAGSRLGGTIQRKVWRCLSQAYVDLHRNRRLQLCAGRRIRVQAPAAGESARSCRRRAESWVFRSKSPRSAHAGTSQEGHRVWLYRHCLRRCSISGDTQLIEDLFPSLWVAFVRIEGLKTCGEIAFNCRDSPIIAE